MQKITLPILLVIILILSAALIYQNQLDYSSSGIAKDDGVSIVRIYLGMSSKELGKEFSVQDAENIIAKYFSGATLGESIGYYDENRIWINDKLKSVLSLHT